MDYDEITSVHVKQNLSSSKIMDLMNQYPNLKTITCPKSVFNRTPKVYIDALETLDINLKIEYKWGKSKPSNVFLKSKVLKLAKEGLSAKEIAKQLDISLSKVYYLIKSSDDDFKFNNYKRKYDDEVRNSVFSLKKDGKSVKYISEKLDIPLRTVYYMLNNK